MDLKQATRLDELDLLRLQNVTLRIERLTYEREKILADVLAKYGTPGEKLDVAIDGAIARTPSPVEAAPADVPPGG